MTLFQNWGDYWWPGQYEECLRNILHLTITNGREIHDPDELATLERRLSTSRAAQLIANPDLVERTFTIDHYHGLHRWLFGDVYEWVGSARVVTTIKGQGQFANPEDIDRLLGLVLNNLGDPARFQTLSRHELLDTLTRTFTGVLMIHPHLEGNGRTSRLFLQQVAHAAGYSIDWSSIPAAQLVDATIAAFRLEPHALQRTLEQITHPLREAPSRDTDREAQLRRRMDTTPQPGSRATPAPSPQPIPPARPDRGDRWRRPSDNGPTPDPGHTL